MSARIAHNVALPCYALGLASAVACAADAPPIDSVPELAGFSERWNNAMESLGVPGFSVAVVKDGQVLAVEGFGKRDLRGNPVTPDTMFYIASATKPYTAMGVCL